MDIIPVSYNNGIGRLLVSIDSITESFVYQKVINRHIIETLNWFYDDIAYTPRKIINGLLIEKLAMEKNIIMYQSSKYYTSILFTINHLENKFPFEIYPELYI